MGKTTFFTKKDFSSKKEKIVKIQAGVSWSSYLWQLKPLGSFSCCWFCCFRPVFLTLFTLVCWRGFFRQKRKNYTDLTLIDHQTIVIKGFWNTFFSLTRELFLKKKQLLLKHFNLFEASFQTSHYDIFWNIFSRSKKKQSFSRGERQKKSAPARRRAHFVFGDDFFSSGNQMVFQKVLNNHYNAWFDRKRLPKKK